MPATTRKQKRDHAEMTMEALQAHVAHNGTDYVELQIRQAPDQPGVTIVPNCQDMQISQASLPGGWHCILKNLQQGTEHVASIVAERQETRSQLHQQPRTTLLKFRTLDTRGLGRRRLRLGILADAHINTEPATANGKRLYGAANMLFQKYAQRLIDEQNVDRLILPGDVCDEGTTAELKIAQSVLSSLRLQVPVHAVIGNHERDPGQFAKMLVPESKDTGYYSVTDKSGVHVIMLATSDQDSLKKDTKQFTWLCLELQKATVNSKVDIILVVLHYSLVLHPLHNRGRWDDGLQVMSNASELLELLHAHQPKVKAIVCGHKNVPSVVVDSHGLLHTLSPQLMQVPCGYDVVDIYDRGLVRLVYEIKEMELQQISRRVAGEAEANHRWGRPEHRSYRHDF